MDERVLNVVELIVRTEGECVVAEIPRQVVFERVNALVERVCAAGKFRTDIDFVFVLPSAPVTLAISTVGPW